MEQFNLIKRAFFGLVPSAMLVLLFGLCPPALSAPDTRSDREPIKIALLVGVNDYFNKNMEDLRFAENDVTAIGRELELLGFKVTLITGRSATRENVQNKIDAFIERAKGLESDDIVFVMFSGHGQQLLAVQEKKIFIDGKYRTVKRTEETPYFCPRDAVPFDPRSHTLRGKTEQQIAEEFRLISLNSLIGDLDRKSNSLRNLLVVDACRNNPAKGKTANISGSTMRELPTGLSILFGAKSGQKSWESSDSNIKHGVMSHFLIEGLRGRAVDDQNEYTWGDLTNFVKKSVIRDRGKLAGGSDRLQNPHSINSSNDVIVLGKLDSKSFTNSIGMSFQLIPGGKFLMGTPESEEGRDDDEFQHEVEITRSFYMGTFEVTQKQWTEVMGSKPWKGANYAKENPSFAASYISWDDATTFCEKLSKRDGRTYRLPTEAEWEYACRAGGSSRYSFGDDVEYFAKYAWYRKNAWDVDEKYAHSVGKKRPNGFGLHDMHGNVLEWCSDWFDSDYYKASPVRDPGGPPAGSSRVLRGGAWGDKATYCRCGYRYFFDPAYRSGSGGFRVALSR